MKNFTPGKSQPWTLLSLFAASSDGPLHRDLKTRLGCEWHTKCYLHSKYFKLALSVFEKLLPVLTHVGRPNDWTTQKCETLVCEMFGLQLFTSDATQIGGRNAGKHIHKKVLTGKSGIEELKLYRGQFWTCFRMSMGQFTLLQMLAPHLGRKSSNYLTSPAGWYNLACHSLWLADRHW